MFLDDIDAKIFDAVKNATYAEPIMSRRITELTKIDNRMIASHVRKMNELNKGIFHIGSAKDKGYWLCRNEEEAIASYLAYGKTVLSMLGESKKIKKQIIETFGMDRDLFWNKVLSQQV
jgi:hypothetical protein